MSDTSRERQPKVSTRTGDTGYTGLLGAERVRKDDPRIEALGDLDEATSAIGLARSHSPAWLAEFLLSLQDTLYVAMAEVAAGANQAILARRLAADDLARLDQVLSSLRERAHLKPKFVTPGDSRLGAMLDVARAVTRRAERRVAGLERTGASGGAHLLAILNRLSDVLFVAARVADSGELGEIEQRPTDDGSPEAVDIRSSP